VPKNNCGCHNQGWYGQSPELDSGSFHLDWPDPLSLGYHTGRSLRFELHSESDLSLHVSAQSFTLNQPACCIVVSGRPKQGFNSHTAMVQIPSHKVLVVHDDLDLPTGKVKTACKRWPWGSQWNAQHHSAFERLPGLSQAQDWHWQTCWAAPCCLFCPSGRTFLD